MIRIPLSADSLARSRFAISPGPEICSTLKARDSGHPYPHIRDRLAAADAEMFEGRSLLEGLIDPRHPYYPDFLAPVCASTVATIEDVLSAVAATPPEVVDYHLDIRFRGRPVWPEVSASIGTDAAYEAWRREMPPAVVDALADGPQKLAHRCADALGAWFDHALAAEWSRTLDVLRADMAYRAEQLATRGAQGLFGDLCESVCWSGGEVRIGSPFAVDVDWADDGLILSPSTVLVSRTELAAERPDRPQLVYPARGVGALWSWRENPADSPAAELIGVTRAAILGELAVPRCTQDLSRQLDLAPATVSFHLGVLHRGGLIRRWRSGARVWYEATDLGSRLQRRCSAPGSAPSAG